MCWTISKLIGKVLFFSVFIFVFSIMFITERTQECIAWVPLKRQEWRALGPAFHISLKTEKYPQ